MSDKLSDRVKEALSYVIGTEEHLPVMDKPRLKQLVDEMTDEEWAQFNKVYQVLSLGFYTGIMPTKDDMEGFFR